MINFWNNLPKAFTVLAPMDGITDYVFRQMILSFGKPDVFFTEFTPVDGMLSKGSERVLLNLKCSKEELPIVAQIWGHNPSQFYKAAKIISKLGFSGIDINMGCPDRVSMKNGSCGALIKNPILAQEVIEATKKGSGNIPVSVKTRIGFESENIESWISFLLKQNLPALTIHLRTVSELSRVPAHWELMSKIIQLRDTINPKTLIIGNGDINSLEEVKDKYKKFRCDGFMIGRGILANPWVFNKKIKLEQIEVKTKLDTYLKHIDIFTKTWGKEKNAAIIRKFCKVYINNFPKAAIFRERLMETKTAEELKEKIIEYKKTI